MMWALAAFAVLVLAAAAIVGSGRWGEMPPVVDDRYPGHVPAGADGVLEGSDLREVRFSVVPRGYSMVQVDQLLARLADQLDADGVRRLHEAWPASAAGQTGATAVEAVAGSDDPSVVTDDPTLGAGTSTPR